MNSDSDQVWSSMASRFTTNDKFLNSVRYGRRSIFPTKNEIILITFSIQGEVVVVVIKQRPVKRKKNYSTLNKGN